jgi:hypothetical protein
VPLDGRASYTPSVKNVAAQTHFHTLHGHYEPDEFENLLSGIEGEALNIIAGSRAVVFPFRRQTDGLFRFISRFKHPEVLIRARPLSIYMPKLSG